MKVKCFLVIPDDEQGVYLPTVQDIAAFIQQHLFYTEKEQDEIVFTITRKTMSQRQYDKLPDYNG